MEPLTLLLVLVVAWMVLGSSGGGSSAGGASANPGNARSVPPEHSSGFALDPVGSGTGACPPGTSWNGRGCTEPSYQTTDQTAQPIGGDAGEALPHRPQHGRHGGGLQHAIIPPRTVGDDNLRVLDTLHQRSGST
ncbi:MAG: hypothetical protein ACJ79H_10005 [Myxococcales bacterium]